MDRERVKQFQEEEDWAGGKGAQLVLLEGGSL